MSSFYFYFFVFAMCTYTGSSLRTIFESPSEERYNYFDTELLEVLNQKEESNVLISPTSIKFVLSMIMEGSIGKTAEEIRSALRLSNDKIITRKEFNSRTSSLQVKGSPNSFKIANQMFVSDRYKVNSNYSNILQQYYGAGVKKIKFEDTKATTHTINNWISNHTSRMITNIVEEKQVNPDTKMMLTSAVYFKGIWATPFNKDRTTKRCFYPKEDQCKNVVMMMETGQYDYGYVSRLDAKAVVLPYEGRKISMLLLLPMDGNNIQQLTRDLVHVSLKSIQSELKKLEVVVQIPQFELSYNEDLIDSLKKLKISKVFGPNANFSNIFTSNPETVKINHILHSAKIEVTEEGTQAAAATGAMFVPLMGGTTNAFIANHPFLFFIIDSTTSSIIFAGKIFSPESSTSNKNLVHNPNDSKNRLYTSQITKNNETQTKHRQPTLTPKFRSIQSTFPFYRAPLGINIPNNSFPQMDASSQYTQYRKSFNSRPVNQVPLFESYMPVSNTEKLKKGKNGVDTSKNRKQTTTEDIRHHVLFFT